MIDLSSPAWQEVSKWAKAENKRLVAMLRDEYTDERTSNIIRGQLKQLDLLVNFAQSGDGPSMDPAPRRNDAIASRVGY